jgi:hypothetical protein
LVVKSFYLIFACGNAFLAAIRLYRAYAGTMPGGLVTLSNSGAATLSKKQRRVNAVFGICYLAFAVSYLFIASVRHT